MRIFKVVLRFKCYEILFIFKFLFYFLSVWFILKIEFLKVFDNVLLLIMSIYWFNLEYILKIFEKLLFCFKLEDKYEIEERFYNIGNLIMSIVNFWSMEYDLEYVFVFKDFWYIMIFIFYDFEMMWCFKFFMK